MMLQAIPRPGFPRERPRQARAATLYRRAVLVAAEHCDADPREVLSARRRKGAVAEARALAAYLSVICFSLSRRQVARLTGRNIMVISRFCAEIELRRDDRNADQAIAALEEALGGTPSGAPAPPRDALSGFADAGLRLPPERHAALQQLWADGSPVREIARRAGRTPSTIYFYASKYPDDFPPRESSPGRPLDPERHAALMVLWARGLTINDIAHRAGRTAVAIHKYVNLHPDDFPPREPR